MEEEMTNSKSKWNRRRERSTNRPSVLSKDVVDMERGKVKVVTGSKEEETMLKENREEFSVDFAQNTPGTLGAPLVKVKRRWD